MAYLQSFTQRHIVPTGFNNMLRMDLSSSGANLTGAEVALYSVAMYNSVFNIDSSAYGNTSLSIEVPSGASTATINVSLADGYYSYADINKTLQLAMKNAGAYLIDNTGNEVYYLNLAENAVQYAAQVDCQPVPSSLGSGWSLPSSGYWAGGLPTGGRVPRLIINNAEFGKVIGFSPATYPSATQTTTQSFVSNITASIHPVSSYMVRCSLLNNPFATPSDAIGTFNSQNTERGQMIDVRPNELLWSPIADGSYSSITVMIVDQLERLVRIRDTNIIITLAFRPKKSS